MPNKPDIGRHGERIKYLTPMNNDCKCPFTCAMHGKCEDCQKNTSNCSSKTKTYCGKNKIIIKEKPVVKKEIVKKKEKKKTYPEWASKEEHGMEPPVFEKIINAHKEVICDTSTCKICNGVGKNKVEKDDEDIYWFLSRYRTVTCSECKGTGIYTDTYFPDYHLLFNETGRLLVCNYRIYDVENGKELTKIEPEQVYKRWQNRDNVSVLNGSYDLLGYKNGKILFYDANPIYKKTGDYVPIDVDGNHYDFTEFCGYKINIREFDEKNGKLLKKYTNEIYDDKIPNNTRYGGKIFRYDFDCSESGNIIIWDKVTRKILFKLPVNDSFDNECQFDYCPATKRLAGCSEEGKIYIWRWDCKNPKTKNDEKYFNELFEKTKEDEEEELKKKREEYSKQQLKKTEEDNEKLKNEASPYYIISFILIIGIIISLLNGIYILSIIVIPIACFFLYTGYKIENPISKW